MMGVFHNQVASHALYASCRFLMVIEDGYKHNPYVSHRQHMHTYMMSLWVQQHACMPQGRACDVWLLLFVCLCSQHNRTHAASVLQALHVVLIRGRLAPGYADDLTLLGCYITAVSTT